MAEPGSVIAAPHTTTPSIQSIKECLRRCERLFAHNTDEQSTPEEEWTQVMTKKHRGGTRWTGGDVRRSLFSDNKAFVQGIYVVAMGFRCAYLVDTISINSHHAETLNKQFSPITTYQDVAFLCEASTKQVYIVNWRVLRARTEIPNSYSNDYGTGSLEREEILWLQTDWGGPMTPTSMPQTLKAAIDEMMAITLNQEDVAVEHVPEKAPRITIQPRHVPALSAWLLEYPVGYTFSDDSAAQQTNDDTPGGRLHRAERTNLDGEPLVLVKVKILGDKELGKSYDVLAFTYPSRLLDEPDLTQQGTHTNGIASAASGQEVRRFVQRIPAVLKERYQSRLRVSESGEKSTIEVTTERVRLEKVVL